ncbi:DUF885 domain-containing protein [Methylophaga sp.]|uniref:DUF885 domain-containing protein n=1 Tax=Methylophaga sp. TaxID=2024840 RepID=UPI003F69970A
MSTEDVSQAYDRIEKSYLRSWCRFNPEAALDAGIEEYAQDLMPCDDTSLGIQLALNEKCLTALDEIDLTQLSPEQQANYRVLHGWALLEHHELMDHDWRYRDPARFLPINALHQLTIRPLEIFNEALLGRLQKIPHQLREAKTYLNKAPELIPPSWLKMATQECESGIHFCHQLSQHPRVRRAISTQGDIEPAIQQAGKSLEELHHVLQRLQSKARGDFACGREHFERLLKYRHFLPVNAQRLRQFGENLFAETKTKLDEVINESGLTLEQVRNHHPAAEQLLNSYQTEMQAAKDFLKEHDLVSMPGRQHLNVVDTPHFLRHQIPFAAYLDPSIADLSQSAFYYVTPVSSEAELVEHNYAAIAQTSVHEAWPGHHLQFVTANQSEEGSALLRRLYPCATLYEGWALYCENMMLEQGYDRYKGQTIVMLRDRLWRALRIIIDVNIHTGEWSQDRAITEMIEKLGFSQQQAEAECNWYSLSPTVPMSYAVGWALITALKDILNPAQGEELKAFHDKLLGSGSIALPLVIEQQFGNAVWQQCCQHVFGEH